MFWSLRSHSSDAARGHAQRGVLSDAGAALQAVRGGVKNALSVRARAGRPSSLRRFLFFFLLGVPSRQGMN